MNAPLTIWSLPEAGPISPPQWEHPEPPPLRMSNQQIVQHVTECLTGQRDTAFGEWKSYWEDSLMEWDAEWPEKRDKIDLIQVDRATDRVLYVGIMLCLHARDLYDSAPIDLLQEEGLI